MSKKMNYYILLSEISLLVVNITFLVAGTFFNTVVILSIWKSSQIRKKLCYFMIFILSCTDLLVVIVLHPLHIFYCIIWYFKGTLDYEHSNVFHFIGSILIVSSFTVLFTMTLERYIGLTRPFFHKTFLTRRRLVSFLVVCLIVLLSVELGDFILKRQSMGHIYGVIVLSLTVLLVISMNCKMFLIAKPRAGNRNVKFKPYYTCALAVTCFLFCCFPVTIYYGLSTTETLNSNSDDAFALWSSLIVVINSTINSIFFWMNTVLKGEGKKLLYGALMCFKS